MVSLATVLLWDASQLAPDLFTPLLVLVLALLALVPERLWRGELVWLVVFASFMTAAHQSHLLLAVGLILVLLLLRRLLGAASQLGRGHAIAVLAPLVLAVVARVSVNLVAFGHSRRTGTPSCWRA